jgi:hypothetical protein
MICAFCEQEISGDVHNFNGSPCCLGCMEEAYEIYEEEPAHPADYCDEDEADYEDDLETLQEQIYDDGYAFGGQYDGFFDQYDDDSSPYSGDYSEM